MESGMAAARRAHHLVLLLHDLAQSLHVECDKHEQLAERAPDSAPPLQQLVHKVNLDAHAHISLLQGTEPSASWLHDGFAADTCMTMMLMQSQSPTQHRTPAGVHIAAPDAD
jgi:hypothetical protein